MKFKNTLILALLGGIHSLAIAMNDPEITIKTTKDNKSIKIPKSTAKLIHLFAALLEEDTNDIDVIELSNEYATEKSVTNIITIVEKLKSELTNIKNQENAEVLKKNIEQRNDSIKLAIKRVKENFKNASGCANTKIEFYQAIQTKNNWDLLQEFADKELEEKVLNQTKNSEKIVYLNQFYNAEIRSFDIDRLHKDCDFNIRQLRNELYQKEHKKNSRIEKLKEKKEKIELLSRNETDNFFSVNAQKEIIALAQKWPLLEQISTILLANHLCLPLECILLICPALNIKEKITFNTLEQIKSYGIPKKISTHIANFIKKDEDKHLEYSSFNNFTLPQYGKVPITFSSDNEIFLFTSHGSISILNLSENKVKKLQKGACSWPQYIAFNPQKTILGSTSEKQFGLYNVSAHELDTFNHRINDNINGEIWCTSNVAFNHTGNQLAVGFSDGYISIYDSTNGKFLETLSVGNDTIKSLGFSEHYLAASFKNTVQLYNLNTKKLERSLLQNKENNGSNISVLTFNKEGTMIAAGAGSVITLWDITSGRIKKILKYHCDSNHVDNIIFNSQGTEIIAHYNFGTVKKWNLQHEHRSRMILVNHHEKVSNVALSPSGKFLAYALKSGGISLLELNNNLLFEQLLFIEYYNQNSGRIPFQLSKLYDSLPEEIKTSFKAPYVQILSESVPKELERFLKPHTLTTTDLTDRLKIITDIHPYTPIWEKQENEIYKQHGFFRKLRL